MKEQNSTLISISTKAFFQVTALLAFFLIVTIILTYIIPAGSFGTLPDGSVDYDSFRPIEGRQGIPIWKGLAAPLLVFFSGDGPRLIAICLFLLILGGAFQIMGDAGGIRVMVGAVTERFQHRRFLVISILSLLFMCFGAFFGLFEEILAMLPVMAVFCLSIGFDSFTGFLICLVSCGFGFASAITNPFTVLFACGIIGADPMEHIWYRVLIFIVMYLLLEGSLYLYVRGIRRDPEKSCTLEHDRKIGSITVKEALGEQGAPEESGASAQQRDARIRRVFGAFLLGSLILILLCSLIPGLSGLTVVILSVYFLVFGILAGALCMDSIGRVTKSFRAGLAATAPTIIIIALSASIKYVFDEGNVLPAIAHQINQMAGGKSIFAVTMILYGIILLLEFFISSSTAKAVFVMGLLTVVNVGLTDQMSVLIYTFADGYTNLLFPTSPVLLIGLSMIEMDYLKWVKKSIPLFLATLVLVLAFLLIGIIIGY